MDIDYANVFALTVYGKIGIKVWICKGEVLAKRDLNPNILAGGGKEGDVRGGFENRGGFDDRRGGGDRRGPGGQGGGDRRGPGGQGGGQGGGANRSGGQGGRR